MSDAPQTPAAKLLADRTRAYRPAAAWHTWGVAAAALDGKPWFTWFDIPRMLRDPRVKFLERMWRSPFQRVKFNVVADDPRVRQYAGRTLRRFWVRSLPWHLMRYFRFGFSAGGAEFHALKGRVALDQVRGIEPQDAKPLEWAVGPNKGQPAGFSARGVGRVLVPHAFWFGGYKEISPWFDVPPISGMFEPWAEKRGRNGAVDARRKWYRKHATSGARVRHPGGESNYGTDEYPRMRDNQDVAREILDAMEDGAGATLVNDLHPSDTGQFDWQIEEPTSRADIAGLRDYPKDLDAEMSAGVCIPTEVFEAAEVGSGWSGRMIPLMSWLGGVDELVGLLVQAFDPVLRYAVTANFGRSAYYEIEPQSLWDQVQEQAKAGPGGGEGKNPVPGLLGQGGDDEPKKSKKLPGGWEPYKRRDGGRGMRNRQTHRYREMSGSGFVSNKVRRKVKALLAARDLSDGRGAGRHAPKGGVTIGGTTYPGGRFIPGDVIENATPAEKAALDGVKPAKLPRKAVVLAGKVLAKGAAAAGKAEHVLKDAVLAAHAKLPAGLKGIVGAAFRLSMAGFDAGQAAAAAAALDRGVSPEAVAKVGHLLAIADVAALKATKAMALLGVPGGAAAFAVAGSLPVASLCYLGYSAAADPVRTAKAALRAVKSAVKATGRASWADAKSVPADFATSVKKLARRAGIGNPAMALSDGRGGGALEDFMADLAGADTARADWLVACFAAALAEAGGDQEAAAELAALAAGGGGGSGGAKLLSAAASGDDDDDLPFAQEIPDDGDGGRADMDADGVVDSRPLQLLAYLAARVQEQFTAKGKPEGAARYLDQLAALASDPDLLGQLLGGVELSWSPYEGPKGGQGWKHDESGRVVYGKHKPGERQAARAATVADRAARAAEAKEAADRLRRGKADPGDVETLAATIPNMTVAQLRTTRQALGTTLGTQWRDNMARVLLNHVRREVEKARETPTLDEPAEPAKRKPPAPGSVRSVRPDQLHVDPARFQFKLHTNAAGVTDELKTVREWNPDFAGTLAVWHDPADGKDYVVNGHHRHELATRLGAKSLAVRYIDAPDAKTARAKGALINIAEGRGTAVDAAKFMRDMGLTVKDFADHGVPLKAGAMADQATALARLSDKAFDRLTRGDLDQGQALAVARHLADHDRQNKLLDYIGKKEDAGKEFTGRVVEELARQMAAVPSVKKTESTLWGDDETDEDTFVQRAEIAAHVRTELAKEFGDFAALASQRRADRTADAGNVLNTEENKKRADAAERAKNLYDQLANRKGAIADALNAGGVALANAKTKKERDNARANALDAARDAVRAEFAALDARTPAQRGGEGGTVPGGEGTPDAGAAGAADGGRANAVDAGLTASPAAGDPFAHATADHGPALAAIRPGESAWVAGHFVHRQSDGQYQIETEKAYHTGTPDTVADRIRHTWKLAAAEKAPADRAIARAAAFVEPDWFGGGAAADEANRRKARVPAGARAVSLDPNTRGRVGVVVRDPDTGAARIQLDGSTQTATDFEPLDSTHSWRVPEADRPKPAPRADTPDLFG